MADLVKRPITTKPLERELVSDMNTNTTKRLERELVSDKNDKNVFVSHSVNDIDNKSDKNFVNDFVNTKVNTKSRTDNDNDNRKHSSKRTLEKVNISDVNVELLKFKFLIRNTRLISSRRQCNAMPPLS